MPATLPLPWLVTLPLGVAWTGQRGGLWVLGARYVQPRRSLPGCDANVLVVGAGSIGSRHARNIERLGATVDITDAFEGRAAVAGTGRPVPFDLARLDC